MTNKLILFLTVFAFCLLACAGLYADVDSTSISDFRQEDKYESWTELERMHNVSMLFADDFNDFPMYEEELYRVNHVSTGRAFLYSLILPGAGEIYTGSKLKAALFLGVEAFSWYSYITNYGDGQDLEDEFRAFANEYWDPTDYRAWLVEVKGVPSDTVAFDDDSTFTHHLPDYKTQQYFEMIGKYEQFLYGWQDTDYDTKDSTSDLRDTYLGMREESNTKFDRARNFAIISIANRIISAFDAALGARKLNKKADRFSEVQLKARLADYHGERIPKLVFTYKFF